MSISSAALTHVSVLATFPSKIHRIFTYSQQLDEMSYILGQTDHQCEYKLLMQLAGQTASNTEPTAPNA